MLKTTVFFGLEKMVNFILARDETAYSRLEKLEDKIISLEFSNIKLISYWLFENKQVRILSDWRGEVDASISGPVQAIARLGLSKAKVAKDLTISGDMHVIEAFKELFAKLDIDWEEQISPFTGDALAFKIGKTLRQTNTWLKASTKSVSQNTKEFIEEEITLLPPRLMMDDFVKDVRTLNRDVDRLSARLKRLQG